MQAVANHTDARVAIRTDLGAIFVSLELSRSKWLITSISPGAGEKMSKFIIRAGDIAALLTRFGDLQRKAEARTGQSFKIISIQEAGLDGFWIHRILEREGIESYIVDPASIATSRRRRRPKTDRIDGEALIRALLAYKRGEPRVCAMLRVLSPEDEDRRRAVRERKALLNKKIRHVNRIKGLLFNQGVSGYEPLNRDRRERLNTLVTGDGRLLPTALKTQISRELDRLELLIKQIGEVEEARNAMLITAEKSASEPALLLNLKGIGREFAAVLWSEGLSRHFNNRRQVAAYAGLAPTPWQSGQVSQEQGVSKSGNPRLRATLVQLAWLWVTSSAHFRAHRMGQGASGAKWRSSEEIRDRRACAQTSRGALEVRQRRDRHRRCRCKSLTRATPHLFQKSARTDQSWQILGRRADETHGLKCRR